MTDEEDEAERELVRHLAAQTAAFLERGMTHILSESAAMNRWLLASLLTLNGGAIVGLASAHEAFRPDAMAVAIQAFVAGNVAAVLAGVVGATSFLFISRDFGVAFAHWNAMAKSGEWDDKAVEPGDKISRKGRVAVALGYGLGLLSLGLFVAGGMMVSNGISSKAPTVATQPKLDTAQTTSSPNQ